MTMLDIAAKRPVAYFEPQTKLGSPVLVVMLHGMCALPEYECPVFRAGATAFGWLLCPPGPAACQGNGAMWTGATAQLSRVIDASITALGEQKPETKAAAPKALVGYSMGASAALRLALASHDEWAALMLVNAGLELHAAPLVKAGVQRVALVAGARDRSAEKLRKSAARLARGGVDARFFSLAETGHYFDQTSEQRLVEPLTWLLTSE
jgi:pimeloyl-ACP methyl ester carboxylesterase